MAEGSRDTNPMTLNERLQVVWSVLNQLTERTANQAQEIKFLRLKVERLEGFIEKLVTQQLDR